MFVKTVIPPVSLGELGIREGASVYFLTTMGETSSVAFNASIFLFIINLLIPSLIGLVLLMKRDNVWKYLTDSFRFSISALPNLSHYN